jgi:hypothetical protein
MTAKTVGLVQRPTISARCAVPATAGLAVLGLVVSGQGVPAAAAPPHGAAHSAERSDWTALRLAGSGARPAALRERGNLTLVRRVSGSAYGVRATSDEAQDTAAGALYRLSVRLRAATARTAGRRLRVIVLERRRGAVLKSWRRIVTLRRSPTLASIAAVPVGDGDSLEMRLIQGGARPGDAFEAGPLRVVVRGVRPRPVPAAAAPPASAGVPAPAPGEPPAPAPPPYAPIDPRQQTALEFGDRSHWLQPWRAYLDTPLVAELRDAIGLNLNVEPGELAATARLAAANGIARARVELSWNLMDYADPGRLADPARVGTLLATLRDNGIRPLILLNSNHGEPVPVRRLDLVTMAAAPAGARSVVLRPDSAASVVPGRTGLDATERFKAAATIITEVGADGVATLSRPLEAALPAGAHPATTLRFEPFARPTLPDGAPNPAFERTLEGWLDYATAIAAQARDALGPGGFDLEVWNELSFGSDFLDINTYYDPAIDTGSGDPFFVTTDAILRRTIAALRDPALGLGPIGIGSGFASQRPWDAGSTSPAGLSALDKHPYPPRLSFPQDQTPSTARALDAQGNPDGARGPDGNWQGAFTPSYQAYFPEHFLAAIQTEHLIRDLSPITTSVFGTDHGRLTSPPGAPAPRVWVTEVNMAPGDGLGAAALSRFRAKVALRSVLAFAAKGVEAVHLYAARDPSGAHQLIDQGFFDALEAGAGYPGDDAGGQALIALRRLATAAAGPGEVDERRALSLAGVSGGEGSEFAGDGTAAHPDLAHRELVAVFPFQGGARRFVVGTYVMTRDLERVRQPALTPDDPARYDLAPVAYRLRLSGLRGCDLSLAATDPLDGVAVPARLVDCSGQEATIELPLTDSPRLLEISEPDVAP